MPIPTSPSPTTVPVTRHRSYFIHEADVTFKVEDYVFRVHKYFFTRESSYFRRLFEPSQFLVQDPPGSSEANPIILEGISSDAFACFLWVFYNPKYSIYDATPGQWSSILGLAQKWGFRDVELLYAPKLHGLLSEIFGLPKIITNGGGQVGPFTCPDGASDKLDRASNLPATAPTTPFKAEALSQSTSTSDAHPPTTDSASAKLAPLKTEDSSKSNARRRQQSRVDGDRSEAGTGAILPDRGATELG
ncbi:hypothetical protein EDB83DRAFT_2312973 [Lactarius deliciosus]|nr:hypothetical protein EDB83DRAFT_2312973 [Lactarius deliciosus]